ncbi:hypothetical protein Ciccas_014510 [Cichlidogyrus casuarinus]|uniref:Uncharacterized protein n=1 Tax=Cichlidogyrus casuarinus TaxID=1844966 RepID=A0ABD2PI41_9PLAT
MGYLVIVSLAGDGGAVAPERVTALSEGGILVRDPVVELAQLSEEESRVVAERCRGASGIRLQMASEDEKKRI